MFNTKTLAKAAIYLGLSSCVLPCYAYITEINSISEVMSNGVTKEDLVVFDIDNTLVETKQTLASDQWFRGYWAMHKGAGYSDEVTAKKVIPVYNSVMHTTKVQLVEHNTLDKVNDLKNTGAKVIGLTSRGHELISPTHRHLSSVNISFDTGDNYHQELNGQHVFHEDGVIFCSGNDKGKCLKHYLDKHSLKPKQIVFVDDHYKHVESIQKLSDSIGVAYKGYRYGYLDEKVDNLDMQVANMQLEHIRIMTDKEAELLHTAFYDRSEVKRA